MQLLGKLEIKSKQKIIEFLNNESTGRIASIDKNGYPQIIPMNFVFVNNVIYMHSHVKGEKLDNIIQNHKVGFEVDKNLEFLPSYFFDPNDASLANTFYISVVIKGECKLVDEKNEMTSALNSLMKKYQPEGKYEPIKPHDDILNHVAVIKVSPEIMTGKYSIGQNIKKEDRIKLAKQIYERNSATCKETLEIMGFKITGDGPVFEKDEIW